jgi:hypothetical protein
MTSTTEIQNQHLKNVLFVVLDFSFMQISCIGSQVFQDFGEFIGAYASLILNGSGDLRLRLSR